VARYDESQWPAYVSVGAAGQGRTRGRQIAQDGGRAVSGGGRGAQDRLHVLGKAWCDNLESYRDYANRLERGRSYVRNGLVIDLQIAPHTVTANGLRVVGVYREDRHQGGAEAAVEVDLRRLRGGIDSLVELLQGRFSKG